MIDVFWYQLLKSRVMKCQLVILLLKCTSFCSQALNSPCHQARLSSSLPLSSGSQMLYSSYNCIRLRLYTLSISVILCSLSTSSFSLLASDGLVGELVKKKKIAIIRTMILRPVHSVRSIGPCFCEYLFALCSHACIDGQSKSTVVWLFLHY